MKCITLIALLFACSAASFLSAKTEKAVMNQLNRMWKHGSSMTPATNLYEEDVKFCGTYETECIPDDMLSMKDNVKVLGMMHKNPIYLQNAGSVFFDTKCSDNALAEIATTSGPLKIKNDVAKSAEYTIEKVTVLFAMQEIIADYTCTEPLELNKEYDVTAVDCKDSQGEDPFEPFKSMIGQVQDVDIVFAEKYMKIDGEEPLILNRLSDVGCTCAKPDYVKPFAFMKRPVTVSEEDVKFCGTYTTGCVSGSGITMESSMKILGMMHKNPIYMQFPNAFYLGETCSEENLFSKVTMNASLKAKDGIDKKMEIVAEKVTLLFANEQGIAAYTCSEPLELNKEYDVTTLDCKDAQGEDPFADMKAMIGKTQEGDMTFGEDYLEVKDEQGTSTRFTRESDMGCTCAKSSLRDAF